MSELKYRTAEHGGADEAEIIHLHQLLRVATADYVTSHADPRQAMAMLMTAMPTYAGVLFGTLMLMGEVSQQDTRRMADSVARNFRSGIKVGLSRAKRAASETGFMGTEQ